MPPRVLDSSGSSARIAALFDDSNVPTIDYEAQAHARLARLAEAQTVIPDTHFRAGRLLAAMLRFAPCERGRRYVACAVAAAASDAACADLASDWLWFLLMPLKCAHKLDEPDFSSLSTPSEEEDLDVATQLRLKTFSDKVRARDGGRCVVVGPKLRLRAEPTHILKRTNEDLPTEEGSATSNSEFITWGILHYYADIPVELTTDPDWQQHIDEPDNGVTLELSVRRMYNNFEWFFKETGPDCYQVRRLSVTDPIVLDLRGDTPVEFTDLSGTGIPLPDPRFIRAHAAIAQVLYDQGIGEYLDEVLLTLIPDVSLVQPGKFADSEDFLIRNDLLRLARYGDIHQLPAEGVGEL
ncbi:hypothetical protein DENSPDRAFT_832315 [Dentipellis sp. KUC8613]|nr:hypothetical protein DENSPDRAFT_832315 [Dentipellis sp. KUC8613]